MIRLLVVGLLLIGVLADAAEVHVLEGTTQSAVFIINRDGHAAQADVMEMRVGMDAAPSPVGQRLADILMLRDPETGLFLWRYQNADADRPGNMIQELNRDSAIFVETGRLLEFRWIAPSLWIRRIAARCSNMDEGLAGVLLTLRAYATAASDIPPYQEVNSAPVLDPRFLHKRGTAEPGITAHLRDVNFHEQGWKISLNGPNGDVASVLLSDKMEIIPAK